MYARLVHARAEEAGRTARQRRTTHWCYPDMGAGSQTHSPGVPEATWIVPTLQKLRNDRRPEADVGAGPSSRCASNFAVFTLAQLAAATLDQFRHVRISSGLVVEPGLNYRFDHLRWDHGKRRRDHGKRRPSKVSSDYLVHLAYNGRRKRAVQDFILSAALGTDATRLRVRRPLRQRRLQVSQPQEHSGAPAECRSRPERTSGAAPTPRAPGWPGTRRQLQSRQRGHSDTAPYHGMPTVRERGCAVA